MRADLKEVRRRICQHLKASGLPKRESARFAAITVKWVDQSGVTWAAKRWKSFGSYAHKCVSGERPNPPQGWASKVNRHGKRILKDRFLAKVVGGAFDSRRSLVWIEAISRIGSALLDEHPTEAKCRKTLDSITSPFTGTELSLPSQAIEDFVSSIWLDNFVLQHARKAMTPLRSTRPSDKRSPYYVTSGDSVRMRTGSRRSVQTISPTWLRNSLLSEELFDEYGYELSQLLTGHAGWVPEWLGEQPALFRDLPVGKLSLLSKDGNAKIRVVASPCWDLQVLLEPLKLALEKVVLHHPCSSVHSQEQGILWVQQQLAAGHKCYGFDQSSFTDRFPYKLQRDLLVAMSRKGFPLTALDLIILDKTTTGWWEVPHLGLHVRYAVGQPMGVNPSFFLATMAHICVVHYAAKLAHWHHPLKDVCRIVGDDIVISDDDVAHQYERLMVDRLGVTINRDKSLMSRTATQFLGKLILSSGPVPSTKIKPIEDAQTLAQKLAFYGARAIRFFRKEIEKHPQVFYPAPAGEGLKPPSISYTDWIRMLDGRKTRLKRSVGALDNFVGLQPKVDEWEDMFKRHQQWDLENPSVSQQELQSNLGFTTPEDDLSIVSGDSDKYSDDRPKATHADLVDHMIRQAPSVHERLTLGGHLLHPVVAEIHPNERPSRLLRNETVLDEVKPSDKASLLANERHAREQVLDALFTRGISTSEEMTNDSSNECSSHSERAAENETEECGFGPC